MRQPPPLSATSHTSSDLTRYGPSAGATLGSTGLVKGVAQQQPDYGIVAHVCSGRERHPATRPRPSVDVIVGDFCLGLADRLTTAPDPLGKTERSTVLLIAVSWQAADEFALLPES